MKTRSVFLIAILLLTGCGGGGSETGGPSEPSSYTAVVTWDAPLETMDGTALLPGEITGYKIYYGTSPGSYSTPVDISAFTCTPRCSLIIEGLGSGTYYFSVVAYDSDGHESGFAEEVSKTY